MERLRLAAHHQDRVLVVRPRAIGVGCDLDAILDGLERVLEKRIRADAVGRRLARRNQFEARSVLDRTSEGHGRLSARDGDRLNQVAGRRLPQPVPHLIVVGLDLTRLNDVGVVAQPVEKLRPVGLRIDGLQLDVLDECLLLRPPLASG